MRYKIELSHISTTYYCFVIFLFVITNSTKVEAEALKRVLSFRPISNSRYSLILDIV